MAVSLLVIAAGIIGTIALLGLLYVAPFSSIAILAGLRTVVGYFWRTAAPVWIVVKRKGPYKVAALLLSFSGFFTHLYTLGQTQDMKYIDLAITALANTLTGSLQQLSASIRTLLGGPGVFQVVAAVYFIAVSIATWYLYWIGWGMMKKRVPELTYYILVAFSLVLLVWGSDGADAVVETFNLVKDAADQAANQPVNSPGTPATNNTTG